MIFLDTHVVLWLYEGLFDRFPLFVKKQLEENELVICPIVQLELEYLFEIQRIKRHSNTIIEELITKSGLKISDTPLELIIKEAIKLSWTRDPFDRMIVANAQVTNSLLLSKDNHIAANYKHTIWA